MGHKWFGFEKKSVICTYRGKVALMPTMKGDIGLLSFSHLFGIFFYIPFKDAPAKLLTVINCVEI